MIFALAILVAAPLGGTISGPALNGTVVPGGADRQLIRKDGCTEVFADCFIRAEDKALIHVRNVGLACAADSERHAYGRANPVLTAPSGKHEWLNKSVFDLADRTCDGWRPASPGDCAIP
ncbi:MAG: DUF3237 domain-containing protein [Novosphingobium sp.]